MAPGRLVDVVHLGLPQESPLQAAARRQQGPASAPEDIRSLERRHIIETLAAAGGVRRIAAERLGMAERTLRYKLQQYRREGFAVPAGGASEDGAE
jgi:two-component system response regulator FlrC